MDVTHSLAWLSHLDAASGSELQQAMVREMERTGVRKLTLAQQGEVVLRWRETLLRQVIESSPDCIKILDRHANLLWMSGPGRRAMQIGETQEIASSPWLESWQGEDLAGARAALESAMAGGTGRFTGFCPTAMGEPRWWDVIVTALATADGTVDRLLSVSRDITGYVHAQQQLQESESHKAGILHAALDCIVTMDHLGRITEFNRSAERVFGHPRDQALGRSVEELLVPSAQRGAHRAGLQRYLQSGASEILGKRVEMTAVRADGSEFPVELSVTRLGEQWPPSFVGFLRDISVRRAAENKASLYAKRQALVAAVGEQALASRDIDALLQHAVEAAAEGVEAGMGQILQLMPDDGSLRTAAAVGWGAQAPPEMAKASPQSRFVLQEGALLCDNLQRETRFAPIDGWLLDHGVASAVQVSIMGSGKVYGLLGVYSRQAGAFSPECLEFMRSIANTIEIAIERRESEDRAAYLARFDVLTGLANRDLLRDRIRLGLVQGGRSGRKVGVLLVGTDHFKSVNETFGIGTGDALLQQVARRLQDCVRPGDTVARMGGDEFAISCLHRHRADHADTAARIARAFAAPFVMGGHVIALSASIGIAVSPDDGDSPDALLQHADAALLRAKEVGRGGHQFFTPELNARFGRRVALESALQRALEHGEFVLHYQPQVCIRSGRIVGAEALIRWIDPERGLVPPGEFIPAAEACGLIVPLGQWVLREACRQAMQWHLAGHRLVVAVNVSAAEVRRTDFIAQLRETLLEAGLPPGSLELELTESLAVDGLERFAELLGAAKALGVSIAIDDFGTGYSSLSHLDRFPVDRVKIDRSFVSTIGASAGNAPVVRAIIAMSHELGLQVVAEGVETPEQSAFVGRHECDIVQGYLYGRPCAAGDFQALLEAGTDHSPMPGTAAAPDALS